MPVCDWSPDPLCVVNPATTTGYTLEVRCNGMTTCTASTMVTVDVVQAPQAEAGPDQNVFVDDPAILDASGTIDPGCPGGLLYEWREGVTVVRPASTDPAWSAPTDTPGVFTYTVVVSCADPPGCESSDDMVLTVDPILAVEYASVSAVWELSAIEPQVLVSWVTASEIDSFVFRVERGSSPDGPFEQLGGTVWARGAWHAYRFADAAAERGSRPWYRIVEYTLDGRGTLSAPFRATDGEKRLGGTRGRDVSVRSR
jgi:hypothetical protein